MASITRPDRVRGRRAFRELARSRQRVRRGPLTVTFVPGAPADRPQVAYAIGRRVGGAVVRNRLRRRLRAVVAECTSWLAPGNYLVGVAPAAVPLSYGELRLMLGRALRAVQSEEAS